jgi:Tol biopolymer transport system component
MCDANGGNLRQIAADTGNTSWPSTSPKYPFVAYLMNWDTPYIYDYARNIVMPLAPDSIKANANGLAWSFSGDKIAFESGHTLYTWSFTGGLQTSWVDEHEIWSPVWSPDGTEIAFNSSDKLEIVNLSSGKSRFVWYAMRQGGRLNWSPDGSQIALEPLNRPYIVLVHPYGNWNLGVPVGENSAVAPQWSNVVW